MNNDNELTYEEHLQAKKQYAPLSLVLQYEQYENILCNLINHTQHYATHKETGIVYDVGVIKSHLNRLREDIQSHESQ